MRAGNTLGAVAGREVARVLERNLEPALEAEVFLRNDRMLVRVKSSTAPRQFQKSYYQTTKLRDVQRDVRKFYGG